MRSLHLIKGQVTRGKPLKPAQLVAARLMAIGKPLYQVAADVGVTQKTAERWAQLPEFVAAVDKLADVTVQEHTKYVAVLTNAAVETLQSIMSDPKISMSIRMRAAIGVLRAFSQNK